MSELHPEIPIVGEHGAVDAVLRTHDSTECALPNCAIHNPSDHLLRHAPQRWRNDLWMLERLCAHVFWHPDIDNLDYIYVTAGEMAATAVSVHSCDGCCGLFETGAREEQGGEKGDKRLSDQEPDTTRLGPLSESSQELTTPIFGPLPDLSMLGPAFTEGSMCDLLGVEREQLKVMVADLAVLQVMTADGVAAFPSFQVGDDGHLLAGLSDVLCELADGVEDPWTWWIWLASRPDRYGGRATWELLRDGDTQAVVQSAGRAAWAWRQ